MPKHDPQSIIAAYCRTLQMRRLLQIALLLVSLIALLMVSYQFDSLQSWRWLFNGTLLLLGLGLTGAWSRRKIDAPRVAAHLNRHFKVLEESCQYLLLQSQELNLLQQIQRNKAGEALLNLFQQGQLKLSYPKLDMRWSIGLLVLATVLFVLPESLRTVQQIDGSVTTKPAPIAAVKDFAIEVHPPSYTGRSVEQHKEQDIEVIEGSEIHWSFEFNDNSKAYRLVFSDGRTLPLNKQSNNRYLAHATIAKTELYSIKTAEGALPEVYSLSVIKDQKPNVRVLEPTATLIEIAKQGEAKVQIKARVEDDFGIGEVNILASVGKGSGEAVKFRDEAFTFDDYQSTDSGRLYQKHWDLKDLGMESGDEVYFTVIARDNKAGEGQTARSKTVIVRWLDDVEEVVAIEGISISYMPEYFRSQRQIIIETEQLIADRQDLSEQAFKDLSVSLGHSQSDLKLKYGQYLGIEQDEAAGAWGGSVAESDSEVEEAHDEHEHEHEHSTEVANGDREQVVAQFAHTHEDVHIGEVSSQNPKAMMKKAVGFMWQAELHLMLYEPTLALPYEKQAYKYLKLAQQAERIYVKRLGFEPPPVSEERRLSGELNDIESQSDSTQAVVDSSRDSVFQQSYALLSRLSPNAQFTSAQIELLNQAKVMLSEMAQQRGNLIRHAATIEKLLIAGSLNIQNCTDCVSKLKHKLWQLIDVTVANPIAGQPMYFNNDALVEAYIKLSQSAEGL